MPAIAVVIAWQLAEESLILQECTRPALGFGDISPSFTDQADVHALRARHAPTQTTYSFTRYQPG